MAEPPFTRGQIEALGQKLDALDLDETERAILLAVFHAAGRGDDDDVAGFMTGSLSGGLTDAFGHRCGHTGCHRPACHKPACQKPACYAPKAL